MKKKQKKAKIKSKGWGGKRSGAGRPRSILHLPPQVVAALNIARSHYSTMKRRKFTETETIALILSDLADKFTGSSGK